MRARRRRKRYGACAAVVGALGVLLLLSLARGGAGATPPSRGKPRFVGQASFSTPGQLAIAGIDGTTVVNGDGTNRRLLRAPQSQVAFSPDGRELAYLRRDGWIVTRNLATGRTRAIVRLDSKAYAYPRWSPDGRSLAYAFGIVPGPTTIAAIDRNGAHRHVVATDASPYFHWSHGGQWIAYWGTTVTKLWLVRPDGGDRHLAITGMSPRVGGFGGLTSRGRAMESESPSSRECHPASASSASKPMAGIADWSLSAATCPSPSFHPMDGRLPISAAAG